MIAEKVAKKELIFNIWSDEQKQTNRAIFKHLYDQFSKEVDPKAVKLIDSLRTKDKSIAKTSR